MPGTQTPPATPPRYISFNESIASPASVTSTSSSKRSSLPFHVLKRFAQDLESEPGGLDRFERSGKNRFSLFLDQKYKQGSDYGPAGSELRGKFRKKLHLWKKYQTEGLYEEKVLKVFGVQPYQSKPTSSVEADLSKLSIQEDEVSDLEEYEEDYIMETTTAKENNKRQIEPKMTTTQKSTGPVHITIDPDRPTRNGKFIVFPIEEIKGVDRKSRYEGYAIFFPMDMRWIDENEQEEPYSGRILSSNMVSIKCVSWPYSFLGLHDEFEGGLPRNIMNAIEDEQHKYADSPALSKYSDFILEFPKGNELSSKVVYDEAGENEELELDILDVEYVRADGSNKTNEETWGYWTVARTDVKSSKRGKVQTKEKKSKAALLKEKLNKRKSNASTENMETEASSEEGNDGGSTGTLEIFEEAENLATRMAETHANFLNREGLSEQNNSTGVEPMDEEANPYRKRAADKSVEALDDDAFADQPGEYHPHQNHFQFKY